MSRLNSQMHPLLNSAIVDSLFAKNIYSVLNFIQIEIKHIAAITNLQYKDILGIRQHLINKYSAVTRDGFSYYNELVANSVLFPTGITSLDVILQGGLSTGNIYEICGLPSSGKTQFNLTLARNAVQISNLNVYYIDTKKDFSVKKLKAVLDANETSNGNFHKVMSQILVKQICTVYDLVNTLYEIKNLLRTKEIRTRLIIIDSLPPLFYPIGEFSKSYNLINAVVNIIQVLAKEFHTAIVVTNIVTLWFENFGVENRFNEKVALGKYWFNVPNARLMIRRIDCTSDCLITIVKSNRFLEGSQCKVEMTETGIV